MKKQKAEDCSFCPLRTSIMKIKSTPANIGSGCCFHVKPMLSYYERLLLKRGEMALRIGMNQGEIAERSDQTVIRMA